MNIATILQMTAECFPERIALTSGSAQYSYAQLHRAAMGAAALFRDSGCQYVSVLDVSSPAVPIALFGGGCPHK